MIKNTVKTITYAAAILVLAQQPAALANESTAVSRVHAIESPANAEGNHSVLFSDGHVHYLSGSSSELTHLKTALENKLPVELSVNENDEVVGTKLLPVMAAADTELSTTEAGDFSATSVDNYEPTMLASGSDAQRYFDAQDGTLSARSQCFRRATYWAYQLYSRYSLKSMKVFLFFSKRYRQEHRYKWWFHVSPYVMAANTEIVLDKTFTDNPLNMKQWTDEFMYNKAECPTVSTYQEYERANDSWREHCYLLKVPMYYHAPADIENRDKRGQIVTHFQSRDLEDAQRVRGWW